MVSHCFICTTLEFDREVEPTSLYNTVGSRVSSVKKQKIDPKQPGEHTGSCRAVRNILRKPFSITKSIQQKTIAVVSHRTNLATQLNSLSRCILLQP